MAHNRTYRQNCGLARSLDLLGERWTMLVVRELDRGPKRFGDLEAGLAGIGPTLLSARLKRLTGCGVVEPVELAQGIAAYGLTPRGERLADALEELALWGVELLEPPGPEIDTRPVWAAMSMRAAMDRASEPAPEGMYAFFVDEQSFWLRVSGAGSQLRDGPPPYQPDAALRSSQEEFLALGTGSRELAGTEHLAISGDEARLRALLSTFRLPVADALVTA